MLRRLMLTVLLTALAQSAVAGAWTQPPGRRQIIQNLSVYSTAEAFDAGGARIEVPRFTKFEANSYLEYGATPTLTLGISGFLQHLRQDAQDSREDKNSGLGETEFFARQRLYEGQGFAFSLQPLIKLPARYRSNNAPVAGRSHWDSELALLGGYSFTLFEQAHYLDLKAAYRFRSGRLHDQLRVAAALGVGITEALRIVPELHWTGRVKAGSAVESLSGQNDYELMKAHLSFVYQLNEEYSVQLGYFRHVAGEDTGAGDGVLLALWRQW